MLIRGQLFWHFTSRLLPLVIRILFLKKTLTLPDTPFLISFPNFCSEHSVTSHCLLYWKVYMRMWSTWKKLLKAVFCDIQSVETHFSICRYILPYLGCVVASCHCAFNEYGHLHCAPHLSGVTSVPGSGTECSLMECFMGSTQVFWAPTLCNKEGWL